MDPLFINVFMDSCRELTCTTKEVDSEAVRGLWGNRFGRNIRGFRTERADEN